MLFFLLPIFFKAIKLILTEEKEQKETIGI